MQLDNFISSLLKVLTRCENIEKLFRDNNIIIIEINHCDGLINFHYRDLKQLKTDFPNIQMMDKKKSDFYNEMLDLFCKLGYPQLELFDIPSDEIIKYLNTERKVDKKLVCC